jgi:hypothetical protein
MLTLSRDLAEGREEIHEILNQEQRLEPNTFGIRVKSVTVTLTRSVTA